MRALFARHHFAVLWLIAAALIVRVVVPAGYMLGQSGGVPGLVICAGMVVPDVARPAVAMPGMDHHGMHHGNMQHAGMQHDAPEKKAADGTQPCAFAAAGFASVLGLDPIFVVAITWIIAATSLNWRRKPDFVVSAIAHLRPLVRGPPVRA